MLRMVFQKIFHPAELTQLKYNYDTARSLMEQGHLLQARILFKQILDKNPNCEGAFRRVIKIDLMLEGQKFDEPANGTHLSCIIRTLLSRGVGLT